MTGAELCFAITAALSMSHGQTKVACKHSDHIVKTSAKIKLDPMIFASLIFHESSFRPRAVSSAGACGLTQVMPRYSKHTCEELKKPRTSILEGANHLGYWLRRAKGDLALALCGYNAGNRCFTSVSFLNKIKRRYSHPIISTSKKMAWFLPMGEKH